MNIQEIINKSEKEFDEKFKIGVEYKPNKEGGLTGNQFAFMKVNDSWIEVDNVDIQNWHSNQLKKVLMEVLEKIDKKLYDRFNLYLWEVLRDEELVKDIKRKYDEEVKRLKELRKYETNNQFRPME